MNAAAATQNRASQNKPADRADPDNATLADLRDDIAAIRADMADAVSDAREVGADTARAAAQKVAAHAKGVQETVHEAINARPIVAVLVAAGVGAIAARLLLSRR